MKCIRCGAQAELIIKGWFDVSPRWIGSCASCVKEIEELRDNKQEEKLFKKRKKRKKRLV